MFSLSVSFILFQGYFMYWGWRLHTILCDECQSLSNAVFASVSVKLMAKCMNYTIIKMRAYSQGRCVDDV